MLIALHDRRVLFFEAPGLARVSIALPDEAKAVGLSRGGAAVLCADGVILTATLDGTFQRLRRIELPADCGRASISADGSLVLVSTHDGREDTGVSRERNGTWSWVSVPDFLCQVTDVRCAPDGESFGYAYLTGQPWSENGSYGNRMYGAAVFTAAGELLREDWDTRSHDETPQLRLAWGSGADPLVLSFEHVPEGEGEVLASWGRRGSGSPPVWNAGPLGAAPVEDEERVELANTAGREIAVSPDGMLVGAVDVAGDVWLVDRTRKRRCLAGQGAVAVELDDAPLIDLVSAAGIWTRRPASTLEWESLV
jgi:hypothetical protein